VSAAWEAYIPTLNSLMPGLFDVEIRERAGLMLLRDRARAAQASVCVPAFETLEVVRRLGDDVALAPLPFEQLHAMRKALVRMTMAARDLEVAFGERSNG